MEYPDFHAKGTPNCKTVENVDLFFPEPYSKGSGEVSRAAKKVCNTGPCPYRAECLAWALFNNEPGVWGGTDEINRRKMKKQAVPVTLGIRVAS